MKRVYICAPLSDNPNRDVIEAVRFGEYAMKECGAAPVVPHFYILMVNPKMIMKPSKENWLILVFYGWSMNFGYSVTLGQMK